MKMQGSIVKDLYSGNLQSSSCGQDKESIATKPDGNMREPELCDSLYDGGYVMDMEWQMRHVHAEGYNKGYDDGLMADSFAKEGFSIGFKNSVSTGYSWGLVKEVSSAMASLPSRLKEILVESEETKSNFQRLHESVKSISTADALKLYYEDEKRKSEEQNEIAEPISRTASLKHHFPETSVYKNYYGQFQSIVNNSPQLDVRILEKGGFVVNLSPDVPLVLILTRRE